MPNVTVDNQLVTFLKEEGDWEKFVVNVTRNPKYNTGNFHKISEPSEAFRWMDTIEGFRYWVDLDDKYTQYIKRNSKYTKSNGKS